MKISPDAFAIQACAEATNMLFGQAIPQTSIQIQKTKKEFKGDLTLVVFPLVRFSKKSPEETAAFIGQYLVDKHNEIIGFNVVKGFLNLSFSDAFWLARFNEIIGNPSSVISTADSKSAMMVEFSSPNTNKPLHLGHLRNIFLGDSVARILAAAGHKVHKVQIINDRGIHICKSMVAWLKFGAGETPESSGLKGDKLVGKYYVAFDKQYKAEMAELMANGATEDEAKDRAPIMLDARETLLRWESGDGDTIALWRKMNSWVYAGFDATYASLGVTFDKLYYESETYLKGKDEVLKGVEKGIFNRRPDGSVWCDLTQDGLDEKLLLRKDGTAVYMTQDIGTAILRFKEFPGLQSQIYTVGNEQEYHFKVLFLVLDKLGYPGTKQNHHLSYGMVELPEGKMKSREGTVVDADDLVDEMDHTAREIANERGIPEDMSQAELQTLFHTIGLGALKYFLLKVDPKKNMLFNPSESIDFNGHTGPFVQYVCVRTKSVLRKSDVSVPSSISTTIPLNDAERGLIIKMTEFKQAIHTAAAEYNPSVVANYAYELAREFNGFYQSSPILKEENATQKQFRLVLCTATGAVIGKSLELLGIDAPERM